MIAPKPTLGLRHIALFVKDLEACERFYVDLLGMAVEWRPDPDNVYLTSGHDNLALHRAPCRDAQVPQAQATAWMPEVEQRREQLPDARERPPAGFAPGGPQRLDHIGFIIESPQEVDIWHDFLRAHDVSMKTAPRTHRDGAHSFYCLDPDGNTVQMIYHPPLIKNSA